MKVAFPKLSNQFAMTVLDRESVYVRAAALVGNDLARAVLRLAANTHEEIHQNQEFEYRRVDEALLDIAAAIQTIRKELYQQHGVRHNAQKALD